MTHLAQALPATLLTHPSAVANAFVAMVIFFILKFILDLPFHCFCSSGSNSHEIMYMCAPSFILFLLLFIIDKHKQFRGYQSQMNKHFNWCTCVGKQFLRLLLIQLIWTAAIFIDGDWYDCYNANNGGNMACTNGSLLDQVIDTKTPDRNESLVIGLSLTMFGLGVWAVWCCCLRICICFQPYYQKVYQNYLSDEVETHLTEELKKLAQERAEIISREHLKIIREQERQPKEKVETTNTEQGSNNAPEQTKANCCVRCLKKIRAFFEKLYNNCEQSFLVCCTNILEVKGQTDPWHTISGMFFHKSDIIESHDVSLFNRHRQKEIEEDVEKQVKELAKERAADSIETRLKKLALQIKDQPQSPPVGALPINDPSPSPPDGALPINDPSPSPPDGALPINDPSPSPPDGALPINDPSPSPPVGALPINDPSPSPPDGALPINDPSSSPPDGALPINDQVKEPAKERAGDSIDIRFSELLLKINECPKEKENGDRSVQISTFTIQQGQAGKARNKIQIKKGDLGSSSAYHKLKD